VPQSTRRSSPVPRHARPRKQHPALRVLAVGLVAVLLGAVSLAGAVAQRLQGNVKHVDIAALVDRPTPTSTSGATEVADAHAARPVNVLLLGSDDRSGENAEIGGANGGMRSDTAIVMHVSADRRRVELVSIPRDSLVDIPACRLTNQKTTKPQRAAMFNSAFALGWDNGGDIASAAACTVTTVQATTGVPVDHVAVVDFAGFQKMVDAVGGVQICVPKAMSDDKTGLNLPAGLNALDGQTALQFARARYETGSDGSDLTRIGHQQQLLAALAHKVLSKAVLTDPVKLMSFANAATSALTTDSGLTSSTATGLAYSLRGIDPAQVVFTTVPNGPAPQDRYRVVWTEAAGRLWAAMAADRPITDALAPPSTPVPSTTSQSSAPAPTATVPSPSASQRAAPLPKDVTSVDQVQAQASAVCGG